MTFKETFTNPASYVLMLLLIALIYAMVNQSYKNKDNENRDQNKN